MTQYNNINTEGKDKSRLIIYNLVRNYKGSKRVLSLPSTNFILENQLLEIGATLDCYEREKSRFKIQKKVMKDNRVKLYNKNVLDVDTQNKYCVIWLDLCCSISPRIINRLIEIVQKDIYEDKAYLSITLMGRREVQSQLLQDFYSTSLGNIREEVLPELLTKFALMVNKDCKLINKHNYIGEGNAPMSMLTFKLTKKQITWK